jgi:hypothetical protein
MVPGAVKHFFRASIQQYASAYNQSGNVPDHNYFSKGRSRGSLKKDREIQRRETKKISLFSYIKKTERVIAHQYPMVSSQRQTVPIARVGLHAPPKEKSCFIFPFIIAEFIRDG